MAGLKSTLAVVVKGGWIMEELVNILSEALGLELVYQHFLKLSNIWMPFKAK